MKNSTGAIIAGVLIAFVPGTQSRAQTNSHDLIVHVYNQAHIPTPSLDRALQRAASVLATADVKPVWVLGSPDAAEAHKFDLSKHEGQRPPGRQFLVLLLAKQVPPEYVRGALGIAFPQSEAGVSAMVFCDRVDRTRHEIDGPTLLGLAIAHEIGHVLLNTSAHGNSGIMKSPWLRADVEQAEARLAMFTRSERNTIRQQLLPDVTSSNVPPTREIVHLELTQGAQAHDTIHGSSVRPSLTIRCYLYTSAERGEVAEMESVAKRIFEASGIETRWIQCTPILTTDRNSSECKRDLDYRTIRLLLRNHAISSASDVLGSWIKGTPTVEIAYDRVQALHRRFRDLSCGVILGHVAAHEIGHSLLGSNGHTVAGIMRPSFRSCDFAEMGRAYLLFLPEESRLLRSELLASAVLAQARSEPYPEH
jgi:hypothetical protein